MQTRTYQLFSSGATGQANAANVAILNPGVIVSVIWACYVDGTADNDNLRAELSFSSNSQLATQSATGVISAIAKWLNLVTSGIFHGEVNIQHVGFSIPVQPGNILYLNTAATAATTASVKCIVVVAER